MDAHQRSSARLAIAVPAPMIGYMLVGVLMSVIVTFTSSTTGTPTSAGAGTAEVLVIDGPWRPLAPVIAEVDHGGTTEA